MQSMMGRKDINTWEVARKCLETKKSIDKRSQLIVSALLSRFFSSLSAPCVFIGSLCPDLGSWSFLISLHGIKKGVVNIEAIRFSGGPHNALPQNSLQD